MSRKSDFLPTFFVLAIKPLDMLFVLYRARDLVGLAIKPLTLHVVIQVRLP